MKLVPNEKEKAVIERASDIVGVDYGEIEIEDLYLIIQDLIVEINRLQEKLDDEIEDKTENYVPRKINYYEEYGLNPNDYH